MEILETPDMDRREGWISLKSVAAWIMAVVGSVFVILGSTFCIYLAANIEDIKRNFAVYAVSTAQMQAQVNKLDAQVDKLADRIQHLELMKAGALIGESKDR